MNLLIFIELDELLAKARESQVRATAAVIQDLKQQKIALIPITSKTRAEISPLLDNFDLTDCFIVKQGSGSSFDSQIKVLIICQPAPSTLLSALAWL